MLCRRFIATRCLHSRISHSPLLPVHCIAFSEIRVAPRCTWVIKPEPSPGCPEKDLCSVNLELLASVLAHFSSWSLCRLNCGLWIHAIPGRDRKLYRKTPEDIAALKKHVFSRKRHSQVLDRMMTDRFKKPTFLPDSPYEPYDNFKPPNFIYKKVWWESMRLYRRINVYVVIKIALVFFAENTLLEKRHGV